jgi:cytochrome oxidase Cu insertion factor (SCO1/SenC/PrrC family)
MNPEDPPVNPQPPTKSLFWYRFKLLALVAVFLSPFIGGWLAFYVFEWRPESGNYGTLVQPVREIDWPPLTTRDGERREDGFGGKWRLLLFARDNCAERCRQNLYYMRQIRILLGRDTERLVNILVTGQPLDEPMKAFLKDYPNLVVIENYRSAALDSQFSVDEAEAVGASPKMYLVDPDDNLMMHYPSENDQNRVLDDIKKLMKISQIG